MAVAAQERIARSEPRLEERRSRDPRTGRVAFLFTAPFFVLFVAFLFWPVVSAVRTSLFNDSLVGPASWAGLDNYADLLSDSTFWGRCGTRRSSRCSACRRWCCCRSGSRCW
jgi:ABC-type spermidine/putrescine transport system permease subunit I